MSGFLAFNPNLVICHHRVKLWSSAQPAYFAIVYPLTHNRKFSILYPGKKKIADFYREELKNIEGIKLLHDIEGVEHNYSYFPILVDKKKYGKSRDELYDIFKHNNIYVRKYFYPLISEFPTHRGLESVHPDKLPVASRVSKQVLCLPIYSYLKLEELNRIKAILNKE